MKIIHLFVELSAPQSLKHTKIKKISDRKFLLLLLPFAYEAISRIKRGIHSEIKNIYRKKKFCTIIKSNLKVLKANKS